MTIKFDGNIDTFKNAVVGKFLNRIGKNDIDFGTCYPVVAYEERDAPVNQEYCGDVEILDVVCAEDGNETEDGQRWDHNDNVAWMVPVYRGNPRVICDNGGGITLQLPGFACFFDDGADCAVTIADWLEDEDTSGWDGDDNHAHCREPHETDDTYWIEELLDLSPSRAQDELTGGSLHTLYGQLVAKLFE